MDRDKKSKWGSISIETLTAHFHKIRNNILSNKREFSIVSNKVKLDTLQEIFGLIVKDSTSQQLNLKKDSEEFIELSYLIEEFRKYMDNFELNKYPPDYVQDLRGSLNEVVLSTKSLALIRKHLKDLMSAQKSAKDLTFFLKEMNPLLEREVPQEIIKSLKDIEKVMKDKSKDVIKHLENRFRK